ncbi:MAG: NADH-quinone oxidoreductase subunit [Actinomycetota bacterium]|nr:NADH-quinone oxidoreductase subunit [Actinomycetota bacterium]
MTPVQHLAFLETGMHRTASEAGFSAPEVDYAAVSPMLVIFGAALLAVLVEAFVPRRFRYAVQVPLTLLSLAGAFGAVVWYSTTGDHLQTAGSMVSDPTGGGVSTLEGAVVIDSVSLFLQGTLLLLAFLSVLIMSERNLDSGGSFTPAASAVPGSPGEEQALRAGFCQSEIYPLLLFTVGGMLLFPAAADLLTMFIALEVLSLPLYLMCGLARRRRLLSQEASLKYFLLGAFSSAFFLYGAALLYGYAGTVRLSGIATAITVPTTDAQLGRDWLMLTGIALVAVGLLFKIGAAPFHSWTPDVYQGAPTPVTGFMAAATKVAAFGALLRVLYVAFSGARWDWEPALWGVAILTMVVGSVIAIVQTDVKRMLAYSSIAHAGFLLTGLLAVDVSGLRSVLFYLVAYGFTTIGAFALVTLVRDSGEEGQIGGEATHLSQWAGLGRRSPLLAATFTLFLLSFAGIPLTSGFSGKFAVFAAAVSHGAWVLALIGVLASLVAAFFYVRVIVLMYFSEPTSGGTAVVAPGAATVFAVVVAAAVTVVLGVAPSLLLDLTRDAVFLP